MLIHAGVPASVSSERSKKLSNQTGRPLALALALAVSETATSSLGLVTGPKGSCSGTSMSYSSQSCAKRAKSSQMCNIASESADEKRPVRKRKRRKYSQCTFVSEESSDESESSDSERSRAPPARKRTSNHRRAPRRKPEPHKPNMALNLKLKNELDIAHSMLRVYALALAQKTRARAAVAAPGVPVRTAQVTSP